MNFITPLEDNLKNVDADLRDRILVAAINRFSYFGIHKSTLAEIAEDVNITRYALNEYFTDKGSLIKAAEEKAVNGYLNILQSKIDFSKPSKEMLLEIIEQRIGYFEKYYMFSNQKNNTGFFEWSEYINSIINNVRVKELDIIQEVISKESSRPAEHAAIIYKALHTMELAFRYSFAIPKPEDFEKLLEEETKLVTLLLEGIKSA